MKKPVLFLGLGLAAAGAFAQEVGQVISAVPVVQQVQVPRQVCQQAMVMAEPQTTGAGGLVGALTGAAIGSQIGSGSGTAAGILIGAVGGALLGNHAEANGARQHAQAVPQCTTQFSSENRTVGYDVTYEYAGRRHTVQMPHDPGPTVQLQVTPVGASAGVPQAVVPQGGAPLAMRPGPVVVAPSIHADAGVVPMAPPVVVTQPAYPIVYHAPVMVPTYGYAPSYYPGYYPPVGISLNIGYSRGWGGHRHRSHSHRRWR